MSAPAAYPTHRMAGFAVVSVIGLVGALVTGRPETAILAAPFALHLALALALDRPPVLSVTAALSAARALEGDEVDLEVRSPTAAVEVLPLLPTGVTRVAVDAGGGSVQVRIAAPRWGVYRVGRVAVRARSPLGLWWSEQVVDAGLALRVHPREEHVRALVAAVEPQPLVGQHPSRLRGDGVDFADLRPYVPGDRARSVNWRATARRGELWVNERHPDRSTEVVLLLDTFGAEETDRTASLDRAVHAAATLARAYERAHDRIALLTFGGHLRWLPPGSGKAQVLRLVDALLDSETLLTDTWAGVTRLPFGVIPPRALILAITPLDDDTAETALVDLRARGFDVAVLVRADTAPSRPPDDEVARCAAVLDRLRREARRLRLERLGVAVADATDDMLAAIRELETWRRHARRVRT